MGSPDPHDSERDLYALFDRLTRRSRRRDTRPMPEIVLMPAGDRDRAGEHQSKLKDFARALGVPAIKESVGGPGGERSAIALIDRISRTEQWPRTKRGFGRRRFPRSDLIRTIEAASADAGGSSAGAGRIVARWNEQARLFGWQGAPLSTPAWWPGIGGGLVAVIAVLAGGIAEQTPRRLLIGAAASLAAALLALFAGSTRQIWLPVLARAGFGGRYHWFVRTSFFSVLGNPGDRDQDDEGSGFEGQLRRVAEGLTTDPDRTLLRSKTFALLEDVRDQHRRFTLSLRGFKRPAPPVVVLPGLSIDNGGVDVLKAISDIRSRRSELDPLLVVASIDAATRDALGYPPTGGGDPMTEYDNWLPRLSHTQDPGGSSRFPYVLAIHVDGDPADPPAADVRRRPRWTWLWSWRSLGTALVLGAILATFAQVHLRSTYCSVGFPMSWNGDTRLHTNADGSRECVGVSTGGVRFERGTVSIGLDGEHRRPSPGNTGARITLADLQRRIEEENRAVLASRDPYVTLVYAGIFTASPGQSGLTVSSVKELAGAYFAQMRNNSSDLPGAVANPLKIRLLPANTGQDMAFSKETADRILDLARRDPTLVGVIGLGRNTEHTQAAIRRLNDAGIPVVSTVNSSDELPTLPHFYGVSATNSDEANAARAAVRAELKGRPISRLLLVHRSPGPSKDIYSREIAADVTAALRPRRTDRVVYVGTEDIANKVKTACEAATYPLVYFAGRAEDVPGLMNGLVQGGCTRERLILLAGDDVTKSPFGTDPHEVPLPANTVVYHSVFVHLPFLIADDGDQTNGFFLLARTLLGIGAPHVQPDDPLLITGHMALTYDATVALGQAAQNAFAGLDLTRTRRGRVDGSASVTSGAVLLELRHLRVRKAATGDIDFRQDDHKRGGPATRGLTLVKITMRDGEADRTPICGRLNGGVPAPGDLDPCPR